MVIVTFSSSTRLDSIRLRSQVLSKFVPLFHYHVRAKIQSGEEKKTKFFFCKQKEKSEWTTSTTTPTTTITMIIYDFILNRHNNGYIKWMALYHFRWFDISGYDQILNVSTINNGWAYTRREICNMYEMMAFLNSHLFSGWYTKQSKWSVPDHSKLPEHSHTHIKYING